MECCCGRCRIRILNSSLFCVESKPNFATGSVSYPNFLDWQKDNSTFDSMAVMRKTSFILTGQGDAEQVSATL